MKKINILTALLIFTSSLLYSQGFELVAGIAPMNVTRYGHASVSLPDGKVLVVGGHTQGFLITATAEIYDPQTASWTLYTIDNPHDGCSYVRLSNGNFMFYGGFSNGYGVGQSTVTTIFDPETVQFTSGPQMNVARAYSTAVKLADNRILIVGNWYNTGDAEIFDPSTNTFTSIGIPFLEKSNPVVFPCNDGSAVILGGSGNYGTPSYSDVVNYNPVSMEFTTLSSELIADETGWITSWSASCSQISDMKISNGNYIFMIYKALSSGEYQYSLAEFNPQTKEVTKANSTPELPLYTGVSPNNWGFGLNLLKDPASDYVYIIASGSTTSPYLSRIYSFDAEFGILEIPEGEMGFDYYLHTSTMSWVNGDILCSGGTITGSNFEITNEAKLLRLQNSLKNESFEKSAGVKVFPNPISSGTFQVQSHTKGISLIEIIDLRGRVVRSIRVNKNDQIHFVERGNLSTGIYFLKMSGSNAVFTERIIFN